MWQLDHGAIACIKLRYVFYFVVHVMHVCRLAGFSVTSSEMAAVFRAMVTDYITSNWEAFVSGNYIEDNPAYTVRDGGITRHDRVLYGAYMRRQGVWG